MNNAENKKEKRLEEEKLERRKAVEGCADGGEKRERCRGWPA